jgi:prepilin-type N-terminal cleavage/methylation domain-containing protein
MRSRDKQAAQGFTLVEIMVATAVTSVIVLAGMAALTMTGKAVRANEQTSDAQQNARMAMEMITHDIKMAGFGPPIDPSRNPPPVGNCGIGGIPVPILPGDNNPTVGVNDTGPDQISLVVPLTVYAAPGITAWQTTAALGLGAVGFANVPINAAILPAMTAAGFGANSFISLGGIVMAQVQGAAAPILLTVPDPGPTVIPSGTHSSFNASPIKSFLSLPVVLPAQMPTISVAVMPPAWFAGLPMPRSILLVVLCRIAMSRRVLVCRSSTGLRICSSPMLATAACCRPPVSPSRMVGSMT